MTDLKELMQQCPIQFDEQELEKREKAIEANFVPEEQVFYSDKVKLFTDYQDKMKKKYKHRPDAFKVSRTGALTLTYTLPPSIAKERLEQALTNAREAYAAEIEEKQAQWIDEQLADLLEQEKQAVLKAQAEKEAQFKQQLLEALKNEN